MAVAIGFLLSLYLQSLKPLQGSQPVTILGIGAAVAASILFVTTLVNRAQIATAERNGRYVDFKVRPWKAIEYTALLSLAAVGLIAIIVDLNSQGLKDHPTRLMVLPIVAVGPAIYFSSYFNPAPPS